VTNTVQLIELPTKPVDNSVEKPFLLVLIDGFYYIFVTLHRF